MVIWKIIAFCKITLFSLIRFYAAFEKKTGRSAKSQKWRKTIAKCGIWTHRKAFERYDKNPIRLPWHDLPWYAKTLINKGFLRLLSSKNKYFINIEDSFEAWQMILLKKMLSHLHWLYFLLLINVSWTW